MRRFLHLLPLVVLTIIYFSSISTHIAYAADCDTGSVGLKISDCFTLNDNQKVSDVYSQPTDLINLIVRNGFILAGVIFLFLIIAAGYQFISGGTKGQEQAKSMLETGAAGFLLMFAAYWIIQIIKAVTGADIPL